MDEERRLKLAKRQLQIEAIRRRETMASLADALESETKHRSLAQRSHDLAGYYAKGDNLADAQALVSLKTFAAGLYRLIDETSRLADNAETHVERIAGDLAQTEQRMRMLEEHQLRANAALKQRLEARDLSFEAGMARKMHGVERSS